METSNGVLPVYNLNQQPQTQDGFFGSGGGGGIMFILFLLLLLGGGNGLFGNNTANQAAQNAMTRADVQAEIQNGFNQNRVESRLDTLQQNVTNGFSSTAQGICNLGTSTATGFAQLQHSLDMSTCAITSAVREDGNLTRAQQAAYREQELRDALWQSQLNAQLAMQSAQMVNQIVPRAQPAYAACSPYGYSVPFGGPVSAAMPVASCGPNPW